MASIPHPDTGEPLLPGDMPPELPTPGAPEPEMDPAQPVPEVGGPKGPEPTRFGDWERRGVAVDF